jgi:hypothetical protein
MWMAVDTLEADSLSAPPGGEGLLPEAVQGQNPIRAQ